MAHPVVINHLRSLGVTALELLPVQQSMPEEHLVGAGMPNLWGYNTIGFFAPHAGYAASGTEGQQVTEFKTMVRRFHEAGIEVILDVVYNHTAEGGQRGPTVSFRGIDNAAYYKLADDRRYYRDYTGTGNTLDVSQPAVLRLIMDSLRYWVTEMHVDGFRFDLASALVRGHHDVDMYGAFIQAINQDPVLRSVKLIAEPWDVGAGGYQVGHFPGLWSEWNDRFRDSVRDFWRGSSAGIADLGWRLSGSADLYAAARRKPRASINFITAHDGFTLNDLVAYNDKHNAANGEDNRDGAEDNVSSNWGVEGETADGAINALRDRVRRALLATLFSSYGTPMLLAGDEINRTQRGNNNAYCQDNELSWLDWTALDDESGTGMLGFVTALAAVRRRYPSLRSAVFLHGIGMIADDLPDTAWFDEAGNPLDSHAWSDAAARLLVLRRATASERRREATLLLLNASEDDRVFTLPAPAFAWIVEIDSARAEQSRRPVDGPDLTVAARSMMILGAELAPPTA